MASPIHTCEFAAAVRRCLPALRRPVIAVANSAGPDSSCLLFLLRQLFPPSALLSIHVLHDLQPAAPVMAAAAAAHAHALGVPHHPIRVPWGVPPFPPVPSGGPLERVARDARYNVLFHVLTRTRAPLLALGHHADDQLETSIIRLACGSSLVGAAGMRPCRRWGMGSPHSPLASFGHLGLNTFILRPLLPFPKDRILATCHAHRLQFIHDPTNSQPQLTPRNAIRQCLRHDPPFSEPVSFPPTASISFAKAQHAFTCLRSIGPDPVGEKQRLYSAVASLTSAANDVDRKATHHLGECALPSPIGTFLLSSPKLLEITDPDVRRALVVRTMRYVSFHPWGSLSADAHRRNHSIQRIIRALWDPNPQSFHPRRFTAGGGVLWSIAIFSPNKPLRVGNQCLYSTLEPDDSFCWLASRTPPFVKNPQGPGRTTLVIDLTEQLRAAMSSDAPTDPIHVLYDGRFLLCIDLSRIPIYIKSVLKKHDETVSIRVVPFTQYYWPRVVLQHEPHPDQVLAVPQENSAVREMSWISVRWIRPLDAI